MCWTLVFESGHRTLGDLWVGGLQVRIPRPEDVEELFYFIILYTKAKGAWKPFVLFLGGKRPRDGDKSGLRALRLSSSNRPDEITCMEHGGNHDETRL